MRRRLLATRLAAAAAPAPLAAQDYIVFQSPSGNIHCLADLSGGGSARCDIMDFTQSYTTPPPDCGLDWGQSFAVGAMGPGQLGCVGDTVLTPGAAVLEYGLSVRLGLVQCTSERTGVTCRNDSGGGFTLSRAAQRLF